MSTDTETRRDTWLELADPPAIDGLRSRRPRADDGEWEALAAIVRAAAVADGVPYRPSATNLREEFEDQSGFDPAHDVVVVEIDGEPIALAGVDRATRGGAAVFETWGNIHPAWRRRGLGRTLLGENLRRARERAADEPADQPVEARTYSAEQEIGHRRLLESVGYEPIRWYFDMRRPTLDDIPDAPLPPGLGLRRVVPDQHRAIWDADVEAFRDHWQAREQTEEDFASLFAKADLDTDLWVVAWDGDQVAGVVQPWIWRDENAELGVARGWLEHISVRRPWRRLGLARALTAEALRRLRAAGMTEAMLGVDAANPTGALGLYESLGFEVHSRSTAWSLPLER
jgi:mycothiol synthase